MNNYRSYQKWCEILPLKESKQINKIAAIESRIAPKNNRREIINHQKNFYKQKEKIQNDFGKIDCCLIYHFIKENDKPFKEFYERHRSLRTKIRHQTRSIATAYKRNITVRTQTVGIDAANNELYWSLPITQNLADICRRDWSIIKNYGFLNWGGKMDKFVDLSKTLRINQKYGIKKRYFMSKEVLILTDSSCDLPQSYLDINNV